MDKNTANLDKSTRLGPIKPFHLKAPGMGALLQFLNTDTPPPPPRQALTVTSNVTTAEVIFFNPHLQFLHKNLIKIPMSIIKKNNDRKIT